MHFVFYRFERIILDKPAQYPTLSFTPFFSLNLKYFQSFQILLSLSVCISFSLSPPPLSLSLSLFVCVSLSLSLSLHHFLSLPLNFTSVPTLRVSFTATVSLSLSPCQSVSSTSKEHHRLHSLCLSRYLSLSLSFSLPYHHLFVSRCASHVISFSFFLTSLPSPLFSLAVSLILHEIFFVLLISLFLSYFYSTLFLTFPLPSVIHPKTPLLLFIAQKRVPLRFLTFSPSPSFLWLSQSLSVCL